LIGTTTDDGTNKLQVNGTIKSSSGGFVFPDGTTQTTANGTTMPTSTLYSVSAGNATLGASSITTTGFRNPFVTIFRNGIRLINGTDYTLNGDNLTINLIGSTIGKNDQFEVLTNVVITPSTAYTPSSQYFTPSSGSTGIPVTYTVGFVWVYQNGSRLIPGVDFTATDGANITFVGFTANGSDTYEVVVLTPMTYANAVSQSNPVLGGPLVFADGSSQGTAAPGRNRIINGACRIAQRGSVAFATGQNGYGGPDRYYAANANSAGGQFTQSQGTITYGGIALNAVVQTVNTAVSSLSTNNFWYGIVQKIEGYNCFDMLGSKAMLSFIFNTNVSGTYSVSINDGPTTANSYVTTFNATANVPQKVLISIATLPTSLATQLSNNMGLQINIGPLNQATYQTSTLNQWLSGVFLTASGSTNWGSTANNFIAATNIKFEVGGAATPMEPRSIGEELSLCQRYYVSDFVSLIGNAFQSNVFVGSSYQLPVFMRSTPSVTLGTPTENVNITGSINLAVWNARSVRLYASSTSGGNVYWDGPLTANAEL
jgi:hypothetical protein